MSLSDRDVSPERHISETRIHNDPESAEVMQNTKQIGPRQPHPPLPPIASCPYLHMFSHIASNINVMHGCVPSCLKLACASALCVWLKSLQLLPVIACIIDLKLASQGLKEEQCLQSPRIPRGVSGATSNQIMCSIVTIAVDVAASCSGRHTAQT